MPCRLFSRRREPSTEYAALVAIARTYDFGAADKRIAEKKATFERREERYKREDEEREQSRRNEERYKGEEQGGRENLERQAREEQNVQHGMADGRGLPAREGHVGFSGQRTAGPVRDGGGEKEEVGWEGMMVGEPSRETVLVR